LSNYISRQGQQRLTDELRQLFEVERPKVVNNVADAAAEGDRSENAEYIYGKKRLREIDRRLEFLNKRLRLVEIIAPPKSVDRVVFLSWVHVQNGETGDERHYRIVGADETDAKQGDISVNSPVGQALLGKQTDDEVSVTTPGGTVDLLVLGVSVERPE
jgi:transcription elongation factor GreB